MQICIAGADLYSWCGFTIRTVSGQPIQKDSHCNSGG